MSTATEISASLIDILFLRDYTTRTVVIGTTLLGVAAGIIGTFTYLRKRALMGDALSHAALPGIAADAVGRVATGCGHVLGLFP